MESEGAKRSLGEKIKRALGVEGSTAKTVLPMLAYSAEHISSAGGPYLIGLYYQAFLTYVEGLSLGEAGIVMLIKSLWDAGIDPFLGLMTDRTRSRLGRHRIYILLGAAPFGIAYFMLWNSFGISAGGRSGWIMLYYIAANIFFTGVASFITVPHTAMLPELAPDYFQRTQYISVGYIFNSTGMLPSFLLASSFLGLIKSQEFTPALRPTFFKLGLTLGAVYILPILICGLTTREKDSRDMETPKVSAAFVFEEYRSVFRNKAFAQYFLMSFLLLFGTAFFTSSKTYFLYEVADAKQHLNLLITLAGFAEMLAFPVNFALTKKFGKQKMAWFTAPFLLVSLGLGFVIGKQTGRGWLGIPWMTAALYAQEMLFPFGGSGINFAVSNIFPDVTDVDELLTGRRREGVIATFSAFLKTATSGVLQFLIGVILEWFGVETKKDGGAGSFLFRARAASLFGPKWGGPAAGLRFVHAFLPLVFTALSLLSLRKYTMTGEEHALIRRVIAGRHGEETDGSEITQAEQERLTEIAGQKWEAMWAGR
ncbi:MAG: MFS transporter [Oscillospiraceae bacterium]|jgi:GPH family glycoside/pentoside/hexuronide:cation symporter|nr:MFS transporter [Oscillospiraceae bacterium]